MPEMRSSGIDWVGTIPINWDIIKCKYISNFINGYSFNSGDLQSEFNYPVIRIGDIKDGGIDNINCLGVLSNIGIEKYKIKENDILLAMSGATVGKVGIAHNIENSYINQRVGIIRSTAAKFLFYCLSTKEFIEYILLGANGSAQPNVSGEVFEKFIIPYPDIETREKIVSFLDKKCYEIDKLCVDIEKQIEILEDYKKSVITETVTKGLNPNVEMEDSKIEWIGMIPKHWKKQKIKNISSLIGSGTTPSSNVIEYYDGDVNWIQSGDLYQVSEIDSVKTQITELGLKSASALKIYHAPFVVIAMYGASVGNTAISKIDACVNQACCCIKTNKNNDLRFLYYWLEHCKADFLSLAIGGGQPNISQEKIKNQVFVAPPIEEQQKIVDYLDKKCSEIGKIITDKKAQLETLAEYKKSLIYEYVTGKKEVPDNIE